MRGLLLLALVAGVLAGGCSTLLRGPVEGFRVTPCGESQPLDLSEHQGKVVVLSFWFSKCPPCRALFRHEKALVERYAGRPFVLLGVNADVDFDEARECQRQAGLTWASFWDGPSKDANGARPGAGPICSAWKVDSFPTLFLIDHQGIVRWRHTGIPAEGELEARIDELLAKAAK
jgi:thiol-disulfide isomerase/thioredoxin